MKKFLVGLLTVALAASMLVGCGKKEEKKKADNSLKDVQSKKELVLGLDSSFPPMGFTDKKDNIVGFDIDLAKEVTKRMGIKLKLQPINWNSNLIQRKLTVYGMVLHTAKPEQKKCYVQNLTWITIRY